MGNNIRVEMVKTAEATRVHTQERATSSYQNPASKRTKNTLAVGNTPLFNKKTIEDLDKKRRVIALLSLVSGLLLCVNVAHLCRLFQSY
jgi:hypothetical protein